MFRFRLEKVLRHRRRLLDSQAKVLQQAAAQVDETRSARSDAAAEITQAVNASETARCGSPQVDMLQLHENHLTALRRELARREQAFRQARRNLAQEREALAAAHRDCEVLERLEQKQRDEWQRAQERRDRKELDEIGSVRAAIRRAQRLS